MAKTGIVELLVLYQHATERAICVRSDEQSKTDVWLPLSMVEVHGEKVRGKVVTIVGPESLFIEKELI